MEKLSVLRSNPTESPSVQCACVMQREAMKFRLSAGLESPVKNKQIWQMLLAEEYKQSLIFKH